MKNKILFLIFLLLNSLIFAQTYIKNGQEVFGYWKIDGSPYIVEGEAIVPKGKVLIIDKGVIVQFKAGKNFEIFKKDGSKEELFDAGYLLVYGILVARGTSSALVKLTSDKEDGFWGGIIFIKSNQNEIENCIIEKTHYIRRFTMQINTSGALTFIASDAKIQNTVIKKSWAAVNAQNNSHVKTVNSVFIENEYGFDVNSDSRVVAVNSIVWGNKNSFFLSPNVSMIVESCILQDLPAGVVDKGNNIINKNPSLNSDYTTGTKSIGYKAGKNRKNIGLDYWIDPSLKDFIPHN